MSWQTEYLAALQARDQREQANKPIIDAYTKLASGRSKQHPARTQTSSAAAPGPVPQGSAKAQRTGTTTANSAGSSKVSSGANIESLQTDLARAQTARAELQEQVAVLTAERDRARTRLEHEAGRAGQAEGAATVLQGRLRDRDEELRGKAKLLDDVHNEAVSLTLQLNVLEDTNRRLVAENAELVDRWMVRMRNEADRMNRESEFS